MPCLALKSLTQFKLLLPTVSIFKEVAKITKIFNFRDKNNSKEPDYEDFSKKNRQQHRASTSRNQQPEVAS